MSGSAQEIESALAASSKFLRDNIDARLTDAQTAISLLIDKPGHVAMLEYLQTIDPADEIDPGAPLLDEAKTQLLFEVEPVLESEPQSPATPEQLDNTVSSSPELDSETQAESAMTHEGPEFTENNIDNISSEREYLNQPFGYFDASDNTDDYQQYLDSSADLADSAGEFIPDVPEGSSAKAEDTNIETVKNGISQAEVDLIADLTKKVATIDAREEHSIRSFLKAIKHQYLDEGQTSMTIGALGDLAHKYNLSPDHTLTHTVGYMLESDDGKGVSKIEIKDLVNYSETYNREVLPWIRHKIESDYDENLRSKIKEEVNSGNSPELATEIDPNDTSEEVVKRLQEQLAAVQQAPANGGGGGGGFGGSDMLGLGKAVESISGIAKSIPPAIDSLGNITGKAMNSGSDVIDSILGRKEDPQIWSNSGVEMSLENADARLKTINSSQAEQIASIRTFMSCKDRAEKAIRQAKVEMENPAGDPEKFFLKARTEVTKGQAALLDLDQAGLASLTGPAKDMLNSAHKSMKETEKSLDKLTKNDSGKFPHGEKLIESIKELLDKLIEFIKSLGVSRGRGNSTTPSPGG